MGDNQIEESALCRILAIMTAREITANETVAFSDLKLLAGASGPCITIVVHIPNPFELSVRLKNAVRTVEKKLRDRGEKPDAIESLLEPVHDLVRTAEDAGIWSNALILFRSPDVFRHFLLYQRAPEVETVEERFQVRALLSSITREQSFHVLCLSRRHIRLLDCTQHRVQPETTGGIPQDMRVWLNTRQPDHDLQDRSAAGPSVGSMKGVTFGTGTDREREDRYLLHFFKEVDRGVNALLRNDAARLMLAGVESEIALYRRVNSYPRLFEKAVLGSPDGLPDQELHKRAMEVVMQSPSEPLESALRDFEKYRDTRRVISDAHEAVKAAWEGRVEDLFISEGSTVRGTGDGDEDLLNAAALETVKHGGRAFALDSKDMPTPSEVVAVLRF